MAIKKYKVESFDRMQYFYGTVHEPRIHCLIRFSEHLKIKEFKKAVLLSTIQIPLLRCCFDTKFGHPFWREENFAIEEIVKIVEADDMDDGQITRLLATSIDIYKELQLKLFLVRGRKEDTLCVIINHMICDGGGLKEYLYRLSELYTQCISNKVDKPRYDKNPRNTKQLFEGFGLIDRLKICTLRYDQSPLKQQTTFRFEGDRSNPIFTTRQIPKEKFIALKAFAKSKNVSINDLILTAYTRILKRMSGSDRVIIPCPVDLRKYLKPDKKPGICNLTSNYICDVMIKREDTFEDTLVQVSKQMNQQKSSLNSLKAVILMEFAFHLFSFPLMKKLFSKLFVVALISYTNLGLIDKNKLSFEGTKIKDVSISGALKYVPCFQLAVSTYDGCCTLSCNLYGTPRDKIECEKFLYNVFNELELAIMS